MKPVPVILVVLTFCFPDSFSQASKSLVSARFNVPKLSRTQTRILCPTYVSKPYPYKALGIKVGDPVAATFKYYPKKNWAVAVSLGRPSSSLYSRYFRSSLIQLVADSIRANPAFRYVGYKVLSDWSATAKILFQVDASQISKGMQFYYGAGWMGRVTKIQYEYLIETTSNLVFEKRSPQGPLICVGFECSNFSIPLSAFVEMEWVMDITFDKGYNRAQGGLGLRYVF